MSFDYIIKHLYTEEDVLRALEAIANSTSIRQARLDSRVPRTTLQDRTYGHKSHKEAAIPLQKLTPVQEKCLTQWILV